MEQKYLTFSLLISSLLIITVSCNTNIKEDHPNTISQPFKISPCIETAFYYYIDNLNCYTSDGCYKDSTVYAIDFLKGLKGFSEEDSLILIYGINSWMTTCMTTDGLKGITNIDNYKVLLFDKYNIGCSFYNSDSLKWISLDSLINFKETVKEGLLFKISNGYIELFAVEPNDFLPIPVVADM